MSLLGDVAPSGGQQIGPSLNGQISKGEEIRARTVREREREGGFFFFLMLRIKGANVATQGLRCQNLKDT